MMPATRRFDCKRSVLREQVNCSKQIHAKARFAGVSCRRMYSLRRYLATASEYRNRHNESDMAESNKTRGGRTGSTERRFCQRIVSSISEKPVSNA